MIAGEPFIAQNFVDGYYIFTRLLVEGDSKPFQVTYTKSASIIPQMIHRQESSQNRQVLVGSQHSGGMHLVNINSYKCIHENFQLTL